MSDTAPDRSISREASSRPDLLIFAILAKITKPDIEWMSRSVDAAFAAQGEIDILIVMRNYEGAELGALFDGEAMTIQAKSLDHVRRYGVVGAPTWATAMINLFDVAVPIDAKTFDLAEEGLAKRWIDRPAEVA